ncbi:hypothetical protein ACFLZ8_01740 [Planctomycetota bacterium]
MPEQNIPQNENDDIKTAVKTGNWKKPALIIILVIIMAALIWAIVSYLKSGEQEFSWVSNKMIAVYIALGFLAALGVAWLILKRTIRTRLKVEKVIREDPDINDWLIIFPWTLKTLYVPTIIASFLAALLMFMQEAGWIFSSINPKVIGGIWFVVFFVNFIIEEYDVSIKLLMISLISLGFFFLWLHLGGWLMSFLRLFTHLALFASSTGFLMIGLIGLLTILLSWLKGLFYYITITPNYMNIQDGPTESGEQIGREDYNTRIDTDDFLERLMGFGKIIITFKDRKREPIVILVWRIQKKAQLLEKVRGKFAIDHPQKLPS